MSPTLVDSSTMVMNRESRCRRRQRRFEEESRAKGEEEEMFDFETYSILFRSAPKVKRRCDGDGTRPRGEGIAFAQLLSRLFLGTCRPCESPERVFSNSIVACPSSVRIFQSKYTKVNANMICTSVGTLQTVSHGRVSQKLS